MISIRQITADDWMEWRELRLAALGEAPYAFGSTLAEWTGGGDTEERWRNRLGAVPYNVIAELDGMSAGIVSGVLTGNDVELISMWVAPFARGMGVGDALVEAVVGWSATIRAERVRLSVKEHNDRAITLYERHGFGDDGPNDEEVRSGAVPERWMTRR